MSRLTGVEKSVLRLVSGFIGRCYATFAVCDGDVSCDRGNLPAGGKLRHLIVARLFFGTLLCRGGGVAYGDMLVSPFTS